MDFQVRRSKICQRMNICLKLISLAAAALLHTPAAAEFDAQVKAVKYAVPPDVDKPRPPAAKAKK